MLFSLASPLKTKRAKFDDWVSSRYSQGLPRVWALGPTSLGSRLKPLGLTSARLR